MLAIENSCLFSNSTVFALSFSQEVRGLPEPTRGQLGSKVKTYRESLEVVSADLRKMQQKIQRSSLLGSPGGAASRPLDFDKSLDARGRMQQNTDKLQNSSAVLDAAHGTLEETLNIATGSMEELGRNRETLNRVRSNVGVVSSTMDEARRIIRSEEGVEALVLFLLALKSNFELSPL